MVVDVAIGVTEEDLDTAQGDPPGRAAGATGGRRGRQRRAGRRLQGLGEFVALSLEDAHPVSALHGRGTGDLLDEEVSLLPIPWRALGPVSTVRTTARGWPRCRRRRGVRGERWGGRRRSRSATPRVAIIGRPNVGKSTLFNQLLGEERSMVHDMPGTTRTPSTRSWTPRRADMLHRHGGTPPPAPPIGGQSITPLPGLAAFERADIAVLVIDATVGASHQDQRRPSASVSRAARPSSC